MAMSLKLLKKTLEKKFPNSDIEITDLKGDENHYHAKVISKLFNDLTKVQQHKLVYEALGDDMGTTLHALQLTTLPTKER